MSLKNNNFLTKYKWWILIAVFFLLVRIAIFLTFWQASLDKGGWQNFYNEAQSAPSVLLMNFHEPCDFHPPLYYTFTSAVLYFFKSQWFIYFSQILLAFISIWLAYKISRLYFSEKISLIAAFILAIEPFSAWHNFLLTSESLFIPIFLIGFYFFFKFFKYEFKKDLIYAGFFFGLASLVRLNAFLLFISLSFLIFILFIFRHMLNLRLLPSFRLKNLIILLFVSNAAFFLVLFPWLIRNKIVYNRFSAANIMASNFYFFNLPPLIALEKNISLAEASKIIEEKKKKEIGDVKISCDSLDVEEFNRQQSYFKTEVKRIIFADFSTYLKMHLTRAIPFFFQPGYFEMYSAYTGEYSKPDFTGAFLKGDLKELFIFLSNFNLKLAIYLFGVLLWGLMSFALILSFIFSYFKDKEKFIFFLTALTIVLYNALTTSPFVLARYRLPIYIFFFLPFAYLFVKLSGRLKAKYESRKSLFFKNNV